MNSTNRNNAPSSCNLPWCYVDPVVCKTSSLVYSRTVLFFPLKLYYSYATCSSGKQQFRQEHRSAIANGMHWNIALPALDYPMHFKRDADGAVVTGIGPLYRNDSVPWEGSMISYVNDMLSKNSNLSGWTFTWASDGSRVEHPGSLWTAAASEVARGLVDVAVSDFWVTAERVKASASPNTSFLLTSP